MFIVAGLHTILKYANKEHDIKLLQSVTPNGLISYGIGLEKRSKKKKFTPQSYYLEMRNYLDKLVDPVFFDTIKWMIDSGGYQISIGYLPKNLIDEFIESYHIFLTNEYEKIDEAFTLDMPISAKFFTDFDTAYEMNKKSYEASINLPDHIRDKMMFVSHFRTINNFELYNKLIYEDEFIKYFKRFSIGGLVVGQSGINKIPINLYTIGFLQIILYFAHRKDKPKSIRFHILGASDFKSVIFFYLLREASKYYYNIDLELSFDSSSIFKRFQRARVLSYFDNHTGISRLVSAKENNLHKLNPTFGKTNLEIILDDIEHMYREVGYNFDKTKYDTIYDSDSGTFIEELRIPLTILEAYQTKKFNDYAESKAKELFSIFLDDPDKFRNEMLDFLINIHKKGLMTDIIRKQANVYKSSLLAIPEFNSIDDLIKYMYTYNNATDSEHMEVAPTWDI